MKISMSKCGLQSMQFHHFQYLDGGKIYRNTNGANHECDIKVGTLGPR